MTVIITFTTIGSDAGPFNLYSNLDGYSSAFAIGVTSSELLAGYPSSVVPDGTTIVRAKSFGICTNFVDLPITPAPPTTTTTSSSSSTTTTSSSSTTTTSSSSTTTTTTTVAVFSITSTPKDVLGQGTLDISGGVAGETISLSFDMDVAGTFSSLSFGVPVTVAVLDSTHLNRTGNMVLNGSGMGSSIFTFDPTNATRNCLVTVTARSSGNPIGIGDDTNIV